MRDHSTPHDKRSKIFNRVQFMGGLIGFVGAGIQFIHDPVWQWTTGVIFLLGTISIANILWEEILFVLGWPRRVIKRFVKDCLAGEMSRIILEHNDLSFKVKDLERKIAVLSGQKPDPLPEKNAQELNPLAKMLAETEANNQRAMKELWEGLRGKFGISDFSK